jgi:hypothetical protein
MKFMMLVKHPENSGMPPVELMEAIGKLSEDAARAGTMIGGGGLAPTAQSTRVRISGGQIQVIDGPFTESKEVIGGFAQFELPSKEEALKGAIQFMELHRKHWPGWEGETEIREMFAAGDCQEQMKQQMSTSQAG